MWLFNLFQRVPYINEMTDQNLIQQHYKHWRIRIFYSMYFGYVCFYLTRKSFTFAMPYMMIALGFTKADLGILGSTLYITYGFSKFINGYISDRSNPRYFMSIGLILTGIFNICFGFSSSMLFFVIFWGLNGWFQGCGWPPCARLLMHWYSQSERGRWWAMLNTSHNIGGGVIPVVVALVAQLYGWRISMFLPGFICIIVGLFLMNRLRDTPQSLGLPKIEKYRNDQKFFKDEEVRDGVLSQREIFIKYVVKNRCIWLLAIAYFFVYTIRTAICDWGQLYLYESKSLSLLIASSCIFSFELGGVVGNIFSGWCSDKVFGGKRGPVNCLWCLFVGCAILYLWAIPNGSFILAATGMFMVGFFVFGPQMLIGLAAAELSHKEMGGSATGFVGWFAYLGAAFAGFPFGKITQDYGWWLFFTVLIMFSIIAAALLSPLWSVKERMESAVI